MGYIFQNVTMVTLTCKDIMTVTWFGLQTYVRGDLILETTQN